MNEHDIFLAALEIADPSQRAEYLHRACAGDAALRRQVESLLAAHDRSGEFLDVPALRQVAARVAAEQRAADVTSAETDGTEEIDLSFLQPSTVPGSLGRLGHYEIQEVLGQGGAGIVLKAFDELLRRVVAIKVMAPELAATSPARKRFLREARAAAAIRHDNVISIYNVEEQPIPFLVMEHIAGQTLQQRLDTTGPLHTEEVVRLGQQIACGLEAAHVLGLIHRDIKPGNILLEPGNDRVKITDFGLARTADDASITQSGVIAGTPLYMSPEQARGETLDQRSDLFSLGSVLYVMCSGRPPFRAATTLAVLRRVAEDQPRPIREIIPEVPAWLTAIVDRLHAKNAADRYNSAKEVADVLGRCLAELQQKGRVESLDDVRSPVGQDPAPDRQDRQERNPAATATRPPRRRWLAAAAVLLALFAGLGLTEATNVTNIRGTVIRLLSPDGALVVEVDDPGVSVSIDGEEMVITGTGAKEIRLKPGQYKVFASKDGKVVSQELVTVTKNGRQVVRITREARPAATAGKEDPDRRAAEWVLSVGGRVQLNGLLQWVSELPAGPFQLTVADLAACRGVTVEGLALLRFCKGLSHLSLESTPVTDAGLAHFKDTSGLMFLNLNHTKQVTDGGLAHFKDCKGLKNLGLCATLITDQGLAHFNDHKSLESLDLSFARQVTDEGLANFTECEGLLHLNLYGTRVTDAGLARFKNCKRLSSLALGKTQVTDAGLAVLKDHQSLERLDLDNTAIGEASVKTLRGLTRLQLLHLKKTKFTEAGIAALAAALPTCRIEWDGGVIEPKTLGGPSPFTAEQRKALEWVLSAGGHLTLIVEGKWLEFKRGGKLPTGPFKVDAVGFGHDVKLDAVALENLSALPPVSFLFTLMNNASVDDETLAKLATIRGLASVQGLDLRGTRVTDAGLAHIKAFSGLLSLSLQGSQITDIGLTHLKALTGLNELWLNSSQVTNAGLAELRRLRLRRLALSRMPQITAAGVRHLVGMTGLTNLGLTETSVSDEGLAALESLPDLKGLDLSGSRVSEEALKSLVRLSKLSGLNLAGVSLTDELLAHLGRLQALEVLALNNSPVGDKGLEHLKSLSALRLLHLEKTKVTKAGVEKLAAALPTCRIQWDGGVIEPQPVIDVLRPAVASLLKAGAKVTVPDGGKQRELKSAAELKDADRVWEISFHGTADKGPLTDLAVLTALRSFPAEGWDSLVGTLFLHGRISIEEFAALVQVPALRAAPGVGLNETRLPDAALRHLAEISNLKSLTLTGAAEVVGDDGLKQIAGLPKLTRFALIGTKITSPGLAVLRGRPWTHLNFVSNPGVDDAAVDHLTAIPTLLSLKLKGTNVSEVGVKKLATALPQCKIEWDGGVIEPQVNLDPDRKAAEYVLSIGGILRVNEEERDIKVATDLPKEAFRLTRIDLQNNQQVNDADLACFKDCNNLTTLYLHATKVSNVGLAHFKGCKNLTHLALPVTQVSDAGLAHFKDCKNLTFLHLANTQVGDAGLAHFKDCKNLTNINLGNTQVSDTGVTHFKDCKNLTALSLLNTEVSDAGLAQFKDCNKLTFLKLLKTKVTAAKIKELQNSLPQCKIEWDGGVIEPKVNLDPDRKAAEWVLSVGGTATLKVAKTQQFLKHSAQLPPGAFQLVSVYLQRNRKVDDEGMANLRGCRDITCLDVRETLVTDAGLAHMKDCKNLESLYLPRLVTDAGLIPFMGCKHLKNLSLASTRVTDAGLATFKDCKLLTDLALGGTKISDAGLAHFRECKLLANLSLYEVPDITDAGLAHFKGCKNMTILTIALSPITDAGLAHFKDCTGITKLDVRETRITDAGLAIAHGFRRLTHLDVRGSKGVTGVGVAAARKALPECRIFWDGGVIEPQVNLDPDRKAAEYVLSIGGILRVNEEERDIKDAAVLPNEAFRLTRVDLQNNQQVNDAGLACFKDCKNLTTLYLHSTQVSDAGLAHFKGCKNLTHLVLQGTQVSDVGLAHFKGCNNLSYFSLGGTKVSDAGLVNFKDCKKLTVLHLGDTKVSDAGLAHFKDCKNLTTLNLSATQVSDVGLPHFKDCKNLTQLSLNGTLVSDAGLAYFKECKTLTVLQLGSTKLSDAGLAHFKDCKNLTILNLQITQVSDAGLAHFKDCNNLKTLNLYATQVSDAGLAHFKECKNLTQLILQNTQVSDAGLAHFKDCKSLTFLGLQKTKVTAAKIKELQKTLPQCKIEWDGGVIEPSTTPD